MPSKSSNDPLHYGLDKYIYQSETDKVICTKTYLLNLFARVRNTSSTNFENILKWVFVSSVKYLLIKYALQGEHSHNKNVVALITLKMPPYSKMWWTIKMYLIVIIFHELGDYHWMWISPLKTAWKKSSTLVTYSIKFKFLLTIQATT